MSKNNSIPVTEAEDNPNIPKKAVALQYDPLVDKAPKVTAKGKGYVAEKILAAAQSNAIPVYQNKTLKYIKEIPAELYTTVAEVLAYIYRMDKNASRSKLK